MARADVRTVETLAHGLKSSIGHWSTAKAYAAARNLEAAARGGAAEVIGEAWDRLRAELPPTQEAVAQLALAPAAS